MSKSRKRLSSVGLCTMATLAMAMLGASTVQAAKPVWMVGGTDIVSASSLIAFAHIEPYEIEKEKTKQNVLIMLSETFSGSIWLACSKAETGSLLFKGGGVATGSIEFSECNTYLKGKISSVCRPKEPIFANSALEIVLHEGKPYVKVTGATGGLFTTITFPNELCILSEEKYDIKGTVWLEDCNGKFEVEALEHLVQEAKVPTKSLGGLFFGSKSAIVDGSAWIEVINGIFTMAQFSGLAS